MPKDCPIGRKGSHDCWECIFSEREDYQYFCGHPDYDKSQDFVPKPSQFHIQFTEEEISVLMMALNHYKYNNPLITDEKWEIADRIQDKLAEAIEYL